MSATTGQRQWHVKRIVVALLAAGAITAGIVIGRRTLAESLQRLTGLARALASHPWLLLLDEPGAGLGKRDCDFMAELIKELRREAGVSIVLVEHNMPFVMALCDRLVVLDFGVTIAEGTPEEVRNSPEVLAAYLGPSVVDRSQLDG